MADGAIGTDMVNRPGIPSGLGYADERQNAYKQVTQNGQDAYSY